MSSLHNFYVVCEVSGRIIIIMSALPTDGMTYRPTATFPVSQECPWRHENVVLTKDHGMHSIFNLRFSHNYQSLESFEKSSFQSISFSWYSQIKNFSHSRDIRHQSARFPFSRWGKNDFFYFPRISNHTGSPSIRSPHRLTDRPNGDRPMTLRNQ